MPLKNIDEIPFVWILGSRVHMVQIPDVLELMEHWIQTGPGKCHQIVVTGMHGLVEGHRDENFKTILNIICFKNWKNIFFHIFLYFTLN